MEVEGIGIVRRRILVEEVRLPERHLETSGQPNYSVTSTDTSSALETVPAPSTSSPVPCSEPGPIPVPKVFNAQEFIPSFFSAPLTSSVSISSNKSETFPVPPASSAPETGLTPAPSSTAEILPVPTFSNTAEIVQPPRSSDAAEKTLPVPVKPETVPVTTSGDSQITPGIRSLSVRCGDASAPCPGSYDTGLCSFRQTIYVNEICFNDRLSTCSYRFQEIFS